MDISKQIEYRKSGAVNDIDTAELLINNNKLLHGLFFCHLVIEKIIKAHVVLATQNVPPKSHNLNWLLEKTDLQLKNDDKLIGKTWRLTTKVDSRIEPFIVSTTRFLNDDYSPLLEIVRQEGIEITA